MQTQRKHPTVRQLRTAHQDTPRRGHMVRRHRTAHQHLMAARRATRQHQDVSMCLQVDVMSMWTNDAEPTR